MNKKSIFFILLIIIAIIIIFILFYNNRKPDLSESEHDSPENEERIETTIYKIQKIDNISDYYTLKSIIGKYYLYYSRAFGGNDSDSNSNYNEALCNMLSPKYLEKYNINSQNIKEHLTEKKDFTVEIYNSYYTTNYNNSIYYLTSGILRDDVTHEAEEFQLILSIDRNNGTFEIYPEEYVVNDLNINVNNLNINDEIPLDYDAPVENRNGDNAFNFSNASYEQYAKELFDRVRTILLYDENKAYELLNKNNTSLFNTDEELKQYILENRSKIYLLTYASYDIRYENENVIFDCYDTNSEYVITLYTNAIMEFTYSLNTI